MCGGAPGGKQGQLWTAESTVPTVAADKPRPPDVWFEGDAIFHTMAMEAPGALARKATVTAPQRGWQLH